MAEFDVQYQTSSVVFSARLVTSSEVRAEIVVGNKRSGTGRKIQPFLASLSVYEK